MIYKYIYNSIDIKKYPSKKPFILINIYYIIIYLYYNLKMKEEAINQKTKNSFFKEK